MTKAAVDFLLRPPMVVRYVAHRNAGIAVQCCLVVLLALGLPSAAQAALPVGGPLGPLPDVGVVNRPDGVGGENSSPSSWNPQISAGGRCVTFATNNRTDVAGNPDYPQIWQRDTLAHRTTLVSRGDGPGGPPLGSWLSTDASSSADGNTVSFTAGTKAFTSNPTGPDNIYARDIGRGETRLVVAGTQSPDGSWVRPVRQVLSGDGKTITYVKQSRTAGQDDRFELVQVDIASLHQTQIAQLATASQLFGYVDEPTVSFDGGVVAFADVDSGVMHLYRRAAGQVQSIVADSVDGNPLRLSADGTRLLFASSDRGLFAESAPNATPDGRAHVYLLDESGQVTMVSRDPQTGKPVAGDFGSLSGDGATAVFGQSQYYGGSTEQYMWSDDLATGTIHYLGWGTAPQLSYSGRYLAYRGWVANAAGASEDQVQLRDLQSPAAAGHLSAPMFGDHCGASPSNPDECPYGHRRPGDSNCDGVVRIAVLGDSFISGEGAAGGPGDASGYRPGTDIYSYSPTRPFAQNRCHRTDRSWAVRLARQLAAPGTAVIDFPTVGEHNTAARGDAIAFLACSGAVTKNVDGRWDDTVCPKANSSACDGQYNEPVQLARLRELEPATIDEVFVSIGGNDAGFGDVIKTCLLSHCLALDEWKRSRLANLDQVKNNVAATLLNIRHAAPNAELYRINYPDPLRPPPNECGSFGSDGIARAFFQLTNPVGYWVNGTQYRIDQAERQWLSGTFLAQLNAKLDAASLAVGARVLDVADAFRGHPICSDNPYANGINAGVSGKDPTATESFHPTWEGQDRLLSAVGTQLPPSTIGSNPNPAPVDLVPTSPTDYLSATVIGTPQGDPIVLTAGSTSYIQIDHAAANEVIVVPTFSLASVAGSGRTNGTGSVAIAVRVPPSAAPGLHHFELWTTDGERLGVVPYMVQTEAGCIGPPDIDGDGLTDACDSNPDDGPAADADHDGVSNSTDLCPLVPGPNTDTDGDGEGDPCDPDAGADLIATSLTGPIAPAPSGAPTAPVQIAASETDPGTITITWSEPEQDGGAPISGYRTDLPGTTSVIEGGPQTRTSILAGLTPGKYQVRVRARNANGLGVPAMTLPVTVAPSSTAPNQTATPTAAISPPVRTTPLISGGTGSTPNHAGTGAPTTGITHAAPAATPDATRLPTVTQRITVKTRARTGHRITLSGVAYGCKRVVVVGPTIKHHRLRRSTNVRAGRWSVTIPRNRGTYRAKCGSASTTRHVS